ncbi:MAG: queuosine precursor transporter [Deltaproteobacteria bacterium]|nr:queuosine precursor transporter [Deltaproteobacteria bacterium]
MSLFDKKTQLFVYLAAIFVSSLILGDLIGGKAFDVAISIGDFRYVQPMSVGLFAFPITFLLTDVVNEFYGRKGARFLTFLGMWIAIFAFVLLNIAQVPNAGTNSYFQDNEFNKIFGIGGRLFVASIVAYLCGQFLDIHVFQFWKSLTKSKHLWLRATGSTLASQIADTFVINLLFWSVMPSLSHTNPRPMEWVLRKAVGEYVLKFLIALLLTPTIYALHNFLAHRMGFDPAPIESQESPSS